jgi:hypothetical protein
MAPTLTAVAQSTSATGLPAARVLLTLTWPGIQTATIQRLDPDGVLRNVRTDRSDDTLVCLNSTSPPRALRRDRTCCTWTRRC